MNVYDFDNTIYNGDSTVDFVLYCFKTKPALLKVLPSQLFNAFLFVIKVRPKKQFKEQLYTFLRKVQNVDDVIDQFVALHIKNIKGWYSTQQKPDDLIISASPDFLIEAFCNRLKITHWMASPVQKYSGELRGPNCFGEEKVRRFDELYHRKDIEFFYSDSYSDAPLAKLSKKAFLVKGDQLLPWEK